MPHRPAGMRALIARLRSLGVRWALELTASYKGTTVRVARSFARYCAKSCT